MLDGDIVVILPNDCSQDGRWHENVTLPDIAMRIQSANPDIDAVVDATIVDGGQAPYVFQSAPQPISPVVLEGLTIRSFAGGLSFRVAAPTIRRCRFPDIVGMAIRLQVFETATIESCEFVGGGMETPSIYSVQRMPRVVDCQFSDTGDRAIQVVSQTEVNCDETDCGGIFGCDFVGGGSRIVDMGTNSLVVRDSYFTDNGGPCVICGPLTMSDCRFENNLNAVSQLVASSNTAAIERCEFVGNVSSSTLLSSNSTMALSDCMFASNAAPIGNVSFGKDSSIQRCGFTDNDGICVRGDAALIADTLFEDNRGGLSGFIFLFGLDAQVLRTDFINNSVVNQDLIRMPSGLTMRECECTMNSAPSGGIVRLAQETVIEDCVFSENTSLSGTVNSQSSSQTRIARCSFTDNAATSGSGAISSMSGGEILDCVFIGNSSKTSGGAVSVGGTPVSNSLFVGNSAAIFGGAIFGFARMSECTVVGNVAGHIGGGVYGGFLENSILYDNRGAIINGRDFSQIGSLGSVSYCDVQGLLALPDQSPTQQQGPGVISADPRFVDPGHWDDMGTPDDLSDDVFIAGDYHLLPDSPCIDGGNPAFVPGIDATDFDGEPRVMSCRVDMGVDEFTQDEVGVIGDFNADGVVSVDDLPEFLSFMLSPYGLGACTADINGDGAVNGLDVSAMAGLILGA